MFRQSFIAAFFLVFVCIALNAEVSLSDDDDDGCDIQYANTCFNDVADDLRYVFDPANNFLEATNISALSDLCSAWYDSLNCTIDIVDDTCKGQGRKTFDTWMDGLYRVVDLLCENGMTNLQAVGLSIRCWSIIKFLQCIETKTNLTKIEDLAKTPVNGKECINLQYAIDDCHHSSTNSLCEGYQPVYATLQTATLEFFHEIHCDEEKTSDTMKSYFNDDDNNNLKDNRSGNFMSYWAVSIFIPFTLLSVIT